MSAVPGPPIGYIYLPVPTPEMLEFAKGWQAGLLKKGKRAHEILRNYEKGWRKGFMRGIGRGVLRNVSNPNRLYILAHGDDIGSRQIGAERGAHVVFDRGLRRWEGGTMKAYTAEELAAVLEAEGLRKAFIDVRVFACGSATIPQGRALVSFAQALATQLHYRGYVGIRVTGYVGKLRTQYAHVHVKPRSREWTAEPFKTAEIGGEVLPANSQKVEFVCHGCASRHH